MLRIVLALLFGVVFSGCVSTGDGLPTHVYGNTRLLVGGASHVDQRGDVTITPVGVNPVVIGVNPQGRPVKGPVVYTTPEQVAAMREQDRLDAQLKMEQRQMWHQQQMERQQLLQQAREAAAYREQLRLQTKLHEQDQLRQSLQNLGQNLGQVVVQIGQNRGTNGGRPADGHRY